MALSHLDEQGKAVMVDVSSKPRVRRCGPGRGPDPHGGRKRFGLLRANLLKKGDALAVARVAGIAAAKRTAELIPLCHNIRIDQVSVDFTLGEDCVEIEAGAVCTESTGIEMEALTAVAVAALTLYDMCKAADKGMRITDIRLLSKTKGSAGVRREFSILSINISERTGVQKKPVARAVLREGHGIEGDAHAGDWHRQVSLLADEDIQTMRGRGIELGFGDFAENVTTRGIDLGALPIGTLLNLGPALLEITQIGKECHHEMRDLPRGGGLRHAPQGGVCPGAARGGDRP